MPGTVLYDLDHTLLGCDSDYEWGRFLAASGAVDAKAYNARNQQFYEDYCNGTLNPQAYLQFVLEALRDIELSRLLEMRSQFFDRHIQPQIRPRAQQLIAQHRTEQRRQIIITSTNAFIAEPIAQALDISTLIAPTPEIRHGQYTGNLLDGPCYQQDKPVRLESWATQHGIELGETWAYSDSFNDLPLLNFVDHPIATDPDPRLRAHATDQGWDIISLADD